MAGVVDSGGRRAGGRGRTGIVLASLALMAALVSGCSAGAMSGSGGSVAAPAAVDDADAAAETDRSVVVVGTMFIAVDDVDAAAADARSIVDAAGGRVDGRDEQRSTRAGDIDTTTTFVLRIPAETFDTVLDDLRDLGDVESLHTELTDITDAVQDVDARIAGLESTLTRLSALQQQATSVDDLLSIEKEIGQRQAELEGLRTQRSTYADQTAFSTLTLSLGRVPLPAQVPDTFWGGFLVGLSALGTFAAGLAVALGIASPWLIIAAIVTFAIIAIVRVSKRRRARKAPAAAVEPVGPWTPDAHAAPSTPTTSAPARFGEGPGIP